MEVFIVLIGVLLNLRVCQHCKIKPLTFLEHKIPLVLPCEHKSLEEEASGAENGLGSICSDYTNIYH